MSWSERFFSVLRCVTVIALCVSGVAAADDRAPLILAIDAEFGVESSTSAQAIERGARIAAAEINAAGGLLGGRPLKIVTRNNNSVPARAAENLRELAADPNVIAVMGGRYSPVVLQLLPQIHQMGIPYLVPWAAADGITGHDHRPAYVFRLSTKDAWAMRKMIDSAARRGLKRVALLVPNSAWGRSAFAAAQTASQARGVTIVKDHWFNIGSTPQFADAYRSLRAGHAQAILFVGNEVEGVALVLEVAGHPESERLPIISHWGITGGNFFSLAQDALNRVDFSFVQTYSFVDARSGRSRQVLAALNRDYGIADPRAIASPVGLAHAYDLTHLLAQAVNRAGTPGRAAVRDALERLPAWSGLVRRYSPAFSPGRYDALDPGQVFMAVYDAQGVIVRRH